VTEEELCIGILATGLVWAGVSAMVLSISIHMEAGRQAWGLGGVFRGLFALRNVPLREVVVRPGRDEALRIRKGEAA